SPTTGGFNEMMFEDKAGAELVRFQAEKDHNELVKNDRASNIGNDRTTQIGNDESQTVGNDLRQQVMNNLGEMVGMNRSRGVGNDETVQIGRNQSIDVGEKFELVCGKSRLLMDKDGNVIIQGVNLVCEMGEHVQFWSALIDHN